jgi:hypothetical protein
MSGSLHENLNVFHVIGSDICNIKIQKKTHNYASLAELLIFITWLITAGSIRHAKEKYFACTMVTRMQVLRLLPTLSLFRVN